MASTFGPPRRLYGEKLCDKSVCMPPKGVWGVVFAVKREGGAMCAWVEGGQGGIEASLIARTDTHPTLASTAPDS